MSQLINHTVNQLVNQYGAGPVVAATFVTGVVAYPLLSKIISKIAPIAEAIINQLSKWFYNMAWVIRMDSMHCSKCARFHKEHMIPTPIPNPK